MSGEDPILIRHSKAATDRNNEPIEKINENN